MIIIIIILITQFENNWIQLIKQIKKSLKFMEKGLTNNITSLAA